MAKTFRKDLLGVEDISVGVGTFSRGTSVGGTQTITKVNLNGLVNTITSVSTTPYAASSSGLYLVDTTSASITFNLPTAVGNTGITLVIKKVDTSGNIVTIDGNGSETIDNLLTRSLITAQQTLTIISDGSNWRILSSF